MQHGKRVVIQTEMLRTSYHIAGCRIPDVALTFLRSILSVEVSAVRVTIYTKPCPQRNEGRYASQKRDQSRSSYSVHSGHDVGSLGASEESGVQRVLRRNNYSSGWSVEACIFGNHITCPDDSNNPLVVECMGCNSRARLNCAGSRSSLFGKAESLMKTRVVALAFTVVFLFTCTLVSCKKSESPQSTGQVSQSSSTEPAPAPNPDRNAYFGEEHIHTSWSMDAWLMGNRITGPDDALKYAQGQTSSTPWATTSRSIRPWISWA